MNRTNSAYREIINADIQNFGSEAPRNDSNFVIDMVFPEKNYLREGMNTICQDSFQK